MKPAFACAMVAVMLSGCSNSIIGEPKSKTLSGGDYVVVSDNWKERSDAIDGPKKRLSYMVRTSDDTGALLFSCEDATPSAVVALSSDENLINSPAEVSVRIGHQEPFKMSFIGRAGDIGFRPGDGSKEEATAFLKRLDGEKEVAIRFDSVIGIPSTDPALVFNITDATEVAHNLDVACSSQHPLHDDSEPAPSQSQPDADDDETPAPAVETATPPAVETPAAPEVDQTAELTPITPPSSWITTDDYPPSAMRAGAVGKVNYSLVVGPDGRVSSCDVVNSSGSDDLDGATCRAVTRHARFTPARDRDGLAINARYDGHIVWSLPNSGAQG